MPILKLSLMKYFKDQEQQINAKWRELELTGKRSLLSPAMRNFELLLLQTILYMVLYWYKIKAKNYPLFASYIAKSQSQNRFHSLLVDSREDKIRNCISINKPETKMISFSHQPTILNFPEEIWLLFMKRPPDLPSTALIRQERVWSPVPVRSISYFEATIATSLAGA